MYIEIGEDKSIHLNRGDQLILWLTNSDSVFQASDTFKFSIMKKGDSNTVYLQKTFTVEEETDSFQIILTPEETRIGDPIRSGSRTYWYEIEYNGVDTLIGGGPDGGKEFVLYPEAATKANQEEGM